MNQWKRLIWIGVALVLFLASSDKFWELLSKIPLIGGFLGLHPSVAGWIQMGQRVCASILTVWQAVRFIPGEKSGKAQKTDSEVLDQYGIDLIPLAVGKLEKQVYLSPEEYADEGSARRKAVERISRWKKKTSDVVFLYSARPCGRRETVCRAIPDKLYPIYQIQCGNWSGAFDDAADEISRFVKDTHCRRATILVRCEYTLTPEEIVEFHKDGEKLQKTLATENKQVALRLVFLGTCKETIRDSRTDWAFQFEPLNAQESERFLKKASTILTENNGGTDAYELTQKRYSGRQLVAAENFARGNPAELIRFLEKILFQNELPNVMDAVQLEWQKRWRGLKLSEQSRRRILAVLHLLIAFYRDKDESVLPLSEILEAVFGIGRGTKEEEEIKTTLREILGLREVTLRPFNLRSISLPDFFCDEFLFSCGEFDREPFHDEWQLVVDQLFTHPDLRAHDYAETYCRAMMDATVRCKLTEALPGERRPLQLYRLIDRAILQVAFSGEQTVRTEAETRRGQICGTLRDWCAWEVEKFLGDHLDILETGEVFSIIAEDLEGYPQNTGEWIARSLSLVLFLSEVEADPMCWWCFAPGANGTPIIYLEMLREKIEELQGDSQAPVQIVDQAWVLCWILRGWLNNSASRPFILRAEADWNAFLEKALVALEQRRSPELRKVEETGKELFNGDADKTIVSLLWFLDPSLNFREQDAQTFYLILLVLGWIQIQPENQDILLKKFISSLRDRVEYDEEKRLPPALNRLICGKEFTVSWQDVNRGIPADPTPADIEALFPRLQQEMDRTCAEFRLDAENTPAFFVNVAATVVGLQARFKENQSYQTAFQKSWEQINAAILAWRYSFTDRDWFNFMKFLQLQTQFLAPEIREEYIRRWESALEKIRASESGEIQIHESELAMFLSTCTPVFYDSEWTIRFQRPLIDLASQSTFPFHLNDEWKIHWMNTVQACTLCFDPCRIISQMFGLAGIPSGTGQSPDRLAESIAKLSPVCQGGLTGALGGALQYAAINLATVARSLPEQQRADYLRGWCDIVAFILSPYIDWLVQGDDSFETIQLLSRMIPFLKSLEKEIGQIEMEDERKRRPSLLAERIVDLINDKFPEDALQDMIGIDMNNPLEGILKNIEYVEKAPGMGVLHALRMAQESITPILKEIGTVSVQKFSGDELQEMHDQISQWYKKIKALYEALTEEARTRGGKMWYDELMRAFAECQAFGIACPDLYAEAREYVEHQLPRK